MPCSVSTTKTSSPARTLSRSAMSSGRVAPIEPPTCLSVIFLTILAASYGGYGKVAFSCYRRQLKVRFQALPETPMRRLSLALALLALLAFPALAAAQDVEPYVEEMSTFSIIARDPATGHLGEVMTSKALAGGNRAWTAKGG